MSDDLNLRRVRIKTVGPGDFTKVAKAAAANHHAVLKPTHYIERGDEVIGALEIGSIPTILVWTNTEKVHSRDSMTILDFFENWVSGTGNNMFILPCGQNSPYLPYIERLGYINMGDYKLFIKKV